jgi:hypothetical protein
MPEENTQSDTVATNNKTSRRVDICASIAIWGAAIAWGCFILLVLIGVTILSDQSSVSSATDGILMVFLFSAMFSSVVSIFSGFMGVLRIKFRKNELSGTGRAIIGILLSIAFWFIAILPAIQVRPPRHRIDHVKSIKPEDVNQSNLKAEEPNNKIEQQSTAILRSEEVNNFQATAEFVPEKKSYLIGEKIGTRLLIKNVSGKSLNKIDTIGQGFKGQCDIVDEQGKSVLLSKIMWGQEWRCSALQMIESGETLTYDGPKIDIRGFDKNGMPGNTMGGSIVYLHPGQYTVIFKLDFSRKIIIETGKHTLVIEPNNQP